MKKITSILITISLIFILSIFINVQVYAFSGSGNGTSSSPYMITNERQFQEIGQDLDASYKLANDIVLPGYNNFWGIGSRYYSFGGTFDGAGYKISSINIDHSNFGDYFGLFAYTSNATIKNVTIVVYKIKVDISMYVGALVGYMSGGTIENCTVIGYDNKAVIIGKAEVGGLVGKNNQGTIINCKSSVNVEALRNSGGGLIGASSGGKVSKCYATGNVNAGEGPGGGLIGGSTTDITISECYATGNVSAYSDGGGLIGWGGAQVTNCFATGNVSCNGSYSGGLIGHSSGRIVNCFSSGKVFGSSQSGGLVGSGSITNSYFDKDNSGYTAPTTQARTTAQLRTKSNFIGWDFNDIWAIYEDACYPYLKALGNPNTMIQSPSGLTSTAKTASSVTLKWNAVSGASNYDISYGNTIISSNITSITVNNLEPDTAYNFKVRARIGNQLGIWSGDITVTTFNELQPPNGLNYTVQSGNSIELSWNAVQDATEYSINYYNETIKTSQTSISIDLLPNVIYQIKVRAENSYSISDWSNDISVKLGAIQTPTGLKCVSQTSDTLILSWNAVADATEYILLANGKQYTANNTSITIDNLAPDTQYSVSVKSKNNSSESDYSKAVMVRTLPLDVIMIRTAEDLENVNYDLSGYYMLANDIDLENIDWNPIGGGYWAVFEGTFDGNGYKIKNLKINYNNQNYAFGLFERSRDATFKNVVLENVDISCDNSDSVGSLIGEMCGGTVQNCSVIGNASVKSYSNIGGLIGYGDGNIIECYSDANVIGDYYVGGLIGCFIDGEVKNCYATGDVISTVTGGGLIGQTVFASVKNCFATGKISNSYNNGGLLGYVGYSSITNSYFNNETSGFNAPADQARTTAQMKSKSTFVGWDFENIWDIEEGLSYPYFKILQIPELPGEPGIPAQPQKIEFSSIIAEEYALAFTAKNISSFDNAVFAIKYDPVKLQLIDFGAQANTDLEIISQDNGIIKFKLHKNLSSGQKWSGVLTSVTFKAKANGSVIINFEQES